MASGYQKVQREVELTTADKNDLTMDQNCVLGLLLLEIRRLNRNIELTYDIDTESDSSEE